MSGDTRERIMETALDLFAQKGYLGTSMNDIAARLGITKAALYKHYTGKQELLDRIVERMGQMDYDQAEAYEMPEALPEGAGQGGLPASLERIQAYSMAQFRHWTEDPFAAHFRRMLTLEQYRDPRMARLYRDYLAAGPVEYMAAIFRSVTDSEEAAMELALEFYGPMFLLYSVYDGAEEKSAVSGLLEESMKGFMARLAGRIAGADRHGDRRTTRRKERGK